MYDTVPAQAGFAALAAAWLDGTADPVSRDRLAAGGLDLRVEDRTDAQGYAAWLQVAARGFLDGERTQEQVDAAFERSGYRRRSAVYDPAAAMPEAPVATIASWIGGLTVPGGRAVPSCAVSAVTVSPTHRRRGIARALLEGELRAAAAAGVPLAMLTVSESTLYGRYGFAPAALSASWRIDTKRARWAGPQPEGRVDFVPRARLRELAPALHERVRLSRPGEIDVPAGHWDGMAGTLPGAKDPGRTRAIQYADAGGEVRGVALYSVHGNDDDFTKASVTIGYLLAETDDAYAALWRFFVEMDLVAQVRADEQSVDEPLRWMIDDQRAAVVTIADHQYVRVLDVPAALTARSYGAPGTLALQVEDPLGIAGGEFLIEVDAQGAAEVHAGTAGDARAGAVPVALGIAELSAMYLGGVSAIALAAAGRIRTPDPAAVARVFGWHQVPRLSIWY
ncbi:GNAT family N-acetyltransferase [Microbacterium hominis]|uniref:GNAT family N-acetyltransferase n=2 Tax=Microbacterium hominis TaxID=162426 RepID=A0A7D4TQB8_9MICO|nr:GNAT family N-acetyltransferase [Microbacterium hominis]